MINKLNKTGPRPKIRLHDQDEIRLEMKNIIYKILAKNFFVCSSTRGLMLIDNIWLLLMMFPLDQIFIKVPSTEFREKELTAENNVRQKPDERQPTGRLFCAHGSVIMTFTLVE